MQVDINSGAPYSSYGTGKTNDLRMPWKYNIDLRINRRIDMRFAKIDLYVDVFNVLNTMYISYIGSSRYYSQENDAAIIDVDVDNSFIYNPEVFNDPRQFRAGISVQF